MKGWVRKTMSDAKWIKIYKHGCKEEPVRGYAKEIYIAGKGALFCTRAIIIGHREMNIAKCEEDMSSRVRYWELYFNSYQTDSIQEPPKPYETEEEMLQKCGDKRADNPYFQHYFGNIGRFIGIVDKKHLAYKMADTLFERRKKWVEEQSQQSDIDKELCVEMAVNGLDALPSA